MCCLDEEEGVTSPYSKEEDATFKGAGFQGAGGVT